MSIHKSTTVPTRIDGDDANLRLSRRDLLLAGTGATAAAAFGIVTSSACAQDAAASTIYLVRYIDVMPMAKTKGAGLLKQLAEASRKEAGAQRFEVLQRTTPADQFVTIEAWKDGQTLDAHMAGSHTKQFLEAVQPLLIAPIDTRVCTATDVGPTKSASGRVLYVVTHVDVFPPGKDQTVGLLKALASASRAEKANLGFEVLAQTKSPNHFEVIEMWQDQDAEDAHEIAPHTKEFRTKLAVLTGALYDQRWYNPL